MGPGDRSWLASHMMRARADANTLALADFCAESIFAWKNKRYDIATNGEAGLLQRLAAFSPRVAIDVGANVGDWSLAAARAWPNASIHAFEIAPPTITELRAILAASPPDIAARIKIIPVGLGERPATVELFFSGEDSTATTMVPGVMDISGPERQFTSITHLEGQVITGDQFLAQHGINHLDMLKIDVEGAEFLVLNGFAGAFDRGAIDIVQFEYGPLNLTTRHFLGDFMDFFAVRGFVTGKVFPEGVAFKKFSLQDEDFVGPNYIACRAERADLIAALGCPPPRLR